MTHFEGEAMQPHELAQEINQADYEVVDGQVKSARLAELIDRSQTVWRALARGQFEQNEHGYVHIGIRDWTGDFQTPSGDHVDALDVDHYDLQGKRTPLGSVARLDASLATATVSQGERSVPLLPSDRRWNAVVGAAERAVGQCILEQREAEQ
jgi:hypothetical protein